MELYQLKLFVDLAEAGNFTRVANDNYVTQAAVTSSSLMKIALTPPSHSQSIKLGERGARGRTWFFILQGVRSTWLTPATKKAVMKKEVQTKETQT